MHTTKWKLCPRCIARHRKNLRKRKRLAAEQTVPDGHRLCNTCDKTKPEDQFISSISRRKKLTAACRRCRDSSHRSQMNPETKVGACRQAWLDWKKDKICNNCGCSDAIEADHLGDKVHKCSDYHWWNINGGQEALKRELAKCQPLCLSCHRLKSKKERNATTNPCYIRRRNIISDEKLRVGACECGCGRKATPENVCTFDWAHKDRATKTIDISNLAKRTDKYFQKQWPLERAKCRLLHCLCHKAETAEENKRKK